MTIAASCALDVTVVVRATQTESGGTSFTIEAVEGPSDVGPGFYTHYDDGGDETEPTTESDALIDAIYEHFGVETGNPSKTRSLLAKAQGWMSDNARA